MTRIFLWIEAIADDCFSIGIVHAPGLAAKNGHWTKACRPIVCYLSTWVPQPTAGSVVHPPRLQSFASHDGSPEVAPF